MKAVLVAGGEPDPADARWLDGAALVVAVDGGAAWLADRGRLPDALVGDLDSVDSRLVERLEADGVEVERHPTAKDSSDAELALAFARNRGATEIVVIGAFGGARIDHEIANVLLLAAAGDEARGALRLVRGRTTVSCLRRGQRAELAGAIGCLVSLFPLGGPARGVTTGGLQYPLEDATLEVGTTRGLSNLIAAQRAWVELREGALLVVEHLEGDEST
ncbi:MAG TPA: thiamine diphosphokinase [Candidatus Limnocylindria bacterium]|nr:thiamine diphosphokinase [Candidatus Limnocylindria bacterium]